MGRDEVAERRRAEQLFEPHHARKVEVVGRLVHQQEVRFAGQFAGHREPLPPPAGQRVGRLVEVLKAHLGERDRGASFALVVFEVVVSEGVQNHLLHGEIRRENVVLGEVADLRAAARTANAVIGRFDSGENFEEGALARAVRADQPDLFPGADFE